MSSRVKVAENWVNRLLPKRGVVEIVVGRVSVMPTRGVDELVVGRTSRLPIRRVEEIMDVGKISGMPTRRVVEIMVVGRTSVLPTRGVVEMVVGRTSGLPTRWVVERIVGMTLRLPTRGVEEIMVGRISGDKSNMAVSDTTNESLRQLLPLVFSLADGVVPANSFSEEFFTCNVFSGVFLEGEFLISDIAEMEEMETVSGNKKT